jgi:hypothetical protein
MPKTRFKGVPEGFDTVPGPVKNFGDDTSDYGKV